MQDSGRTQKVFFGLSKKSAAHVAFLGLMGIVALQGNASGGAERSSLFYSYISGEEVAEGPLDPSAYAQNEGPGIGGARLAVIDTSDVNLITFDDPEVRFAETLSGNVAKGTLQPMVPEPASSEKTSTSKKSRIYTVQEGDTIAGIAAQFDISVNTVLWANGLSSRDTIKVGDYITILPITGALHTVQSGDTVSGIAEKYDVKSQEIITYNKLGENARLSIGQKVIIPDGYIAPQTAPRIVPAASQLARESNSGPTPEPAPASGKGFIWPTTTRHISQGYTWGHRGIDIDNRSRPPVFAAESGTITFAGWLGAYGNLVIVNHGSGWVTYYAHLEKFYVSKGQAVAKGDAIAKMGSTGRSTGPHVHFEIRKNGKNINPLSMY